MEFRLFGKHIAGTPKPHAPLQPDKRAVHAHATGLTVYTRRLDGWTARPDRKITEIELAGWKLEHRQQKTNRHGRNIDILTFRRAQP